MRFMKTKNFVLPVALALGLFGLSSFAHAQVPASGFLADYQYQVANLPSVEAAQALMNTETRDTASNSVCANRADVWTYMMHKGQNVQVGKVFIHFTKLGQANENKQWAYHVAPYVVVDGQEMVLDNGFDQFHHAPALLSDWTNYFGKSSNCVVLDPTHNPEHLKLEKNDLPNDSVDPLTYTRGSARQYPTIEGICYIRKVPMYYVYPIDVYGADLTLSGQTQFSKYLIHDFDQDDVLAACRQALTLGARIAKSCSNYLGITNN